MSSVDEGEKAMAIECYYGSCRFHGTREVPPDEGPFCHQRECLATEQELRRFEAERVSEEAERNAGVPAVDGGHKK